MKNFIFCCVLLTGSLLFATPGWDSDKGCWDDSDVSHDCQWSKDSNGDDICNMSVGHPEDSLCENSSTSGESFSSQMDSVSLGSDGDYSDASHNYSHRGPDSYQGMGRQDFIRECKAKRSEGLHQIADASRAICTFKEQMAFQSYAKSIVDREESAIHYNALKLPSISREAQIRGMIQREIKKGGDIAILHDQLSRLTPEQLNEMIKLYEGNGIIETIDPLDLWTMGSMATSIGWKGLCFTPDTLVQKASGELVPIATLKIGEIVKSYNFINGAYEDKIIKNSLHYDVSELVTITTDNDAFIKATPNHEFYIENKQKWVPAFRLSPCDQFKSYSGEIIFVKHIGIEHLDSPIEVYNIEVEANHNYFISQDKILVKNCSLAKTVVENKVTVSAFFNAVKVAATGLGKSTAEILKDLKASVLQQGAKEGVVEIEAFVTKWGEKKITSSVAKFGIKEAEQIKSITELSKQSGKSIESLMSSFKGSKTKLGKEFEDHLAQVLGGQGSFKLGGREFDGKIGNIWYEAKTGQFWQNIGKFKSDMGHRLTLAKDNSASYHFFSTKPIPQDVKEWLGPVKK